MDDVILLGAGFSRAISDQMPLLTDLSAELRESVPDAPGENIEQWMTYLSQPYPWLSEPENLRNRAAFLELTRQIGELLGSRADSTLDRLSECPPWLAELAKHSFERKMPLITLNYDTLFESALMSLTYKDANGKDEHLALDDLYPVPMTNVGSRRGNIYWAGGAISCCKLYKLHGSINWYYSGATAATGETVYYHSVYGWGNGDDEDHAADTRTKFISDKVPLLVPPVVEKASYFQHETIRALWGLAGQAIRSARRLVCNGYSLPPTDLSFRFFLQSNAPRERGTICIVNTDKDSPKHYESLLGKWYDIDARYVGLPTEESVSELFTSAMA